MKKLIIVAIAMLGFNFALQAQTPTATKKAEKAKTHVAATGTTAEVAATPATHSNKAKKGKRKHHAKASAASKAPSASNTKLKTDGTPDMRYKENKELAKTSGTNKTIAKTNKKQ